MGLFITLAKPTAPMKKEVASAGVLDTPFGKFARLQILTIEDLFAGTKPAMPSNASRCSPSAEDCSSSDARWYLAGFSKLDVCTLFLADPI